MALSKLQQVDMINFQLKFKDFYKQRGRKRDPLEVYDEWAHIEMDYLEGVSPFKYFESINDIQVLVDMLKQYEEDIPPLLIRRIKEFGERSYEPLCLLALDQKLSGKDFFRHGPINAIYILGEMRDMALLPQYVKILEACVEENEIFQYTVDAIMKLGNETTEELIKNIKSTDNEFLRSHLAWVLSRIAKDEKIFELLIDLCQNSRFWKGYYAEILCDYGDKRAIPVLQRLVCEHSFSYEEVDQIERALVLLGGEWNWEYEEKGLLPSKGTVKPVSRQSVKEEKVERKLAAFKQRKLTEINQETDGAPKEKKKKTERKAKAQKEGKKKKKSRKRSKKK